VDPIEFRYQDTEARPQATRDLLSCIVEYRMSADSLPPQDKELVMNECNKAEQWLREMRQQQDLYPKNFDPVLLSIDIQSKTEDLNSYAFSPFCFPFQRFIIRLSLYRLILSQN